MSGWRSRASQLISGAGISSFHLPSARMILLTIHTANTTHAIVSPMEREDLGLEEDMIGGLVGSSGITAQ